jgi:NitT/TauT family transport system permease protein
MSQIHTPVAVADRQANAGRTRPTAPYVWWADALAFAAFSAVAVGVVIAASRWVAPLTPTTTISLSPDVLPLYAGFSTLRMALAYLLALAFSLIYARLAAASQRAETVMLPALDILQSIPILSFLPGVVLALVALFPRSNVGVELAAIVLIFTSQAWNMTFSFHQSLVTIPKELREVAAIYRLTFWQRFTRLELPFGMLPLIWNSMMSWAGGWFFLMAAEQFSLGPRSFELPGLGSYLQAAANAGDVGALALGLLTLILVIVLLDQFLWRPLLTWADHFKLEQTASAQVPTSHVLRALRRSRALAWCAEHLFTPLGVWLDQMSVRGYRPALRPRASAQPGLADLRVKPLARRLLGRRLAQGAVALALAVAVAWGVVAGVVLLARLGSADWAAIVVATAATLLRTTLALVIAVAWTVPAGVAIGMNPRLARIAQPLAQLAASIPATALFPVLLLVLIGLPGGLNIAAVALMLLGTQWYVLFNVIAGAMAIPSDLREAAEVFHMSGWRRWRTLILPAIFPSLVTGMITATGGAWNASIVSEYVSFNNHIFSTVGLGALIAQAAYVNDFALLLAATLAMALTVVALNRLVWRRLYRLAAQRFRLD